MAPPGVLAQPVFRLWRRRRHRRQGRSWARSSNFALKKAGCAIGPPRQKSPWLSLTRLADEPDRFMDEARHVSDEAYSPNDE